MCHFKIPKFSHFLQAKSGIRTMICTVIKNYARIILCATTWSCLCSAMQRPSGHRQTKWNGVIRLKKCDFVLSHSIKLYQPYSWYVHMYSVCINYTLITMKFLSPAHTCALNSRLVQSPAWLACLPQWLHGIADLTMYKPNSSFHPQTCSSGGLYISFDGNSILSAV